MLVTIPVPGLRKRPPVIVLISMPVWEGLKGLMYVTAAGSKGITVIVCVAGSSDSDMPLTVIPVFPVGVGDGVSSDVGAVGEEESSPPQPATVPTTSSTATTSTAHLRIFSKETGYRNLAGETTP